MLYVPSSAKDMSIVTGSTVGLYWQEVYAVASWGGLTPSPQGPGSTFSFMSIMNDSCLTDGLCGL